jgi:hypothetical protein
MILDTEWQRFNRFEVRTTEQYRAVVVVLWGFTALFYGLGDTGLTVVVQQLGGFESNPVARGFLRKAGYVGLAVHKALVFLVLAALWRYYPTVGAFSPDPWRLVVPALAATRGAYLVGLHAHNISVLLH